MRHLMWVLTWIAVGIGGALGAATVIMLSSSRTSPPAQHQPAPDVSPSASEPVLVNKPRPTTTTTGRSRNVHQAADDLID